MVLSSHLKGRRSYKLLQHRTVLHQTHSSCLYRPCKKTCICCKGEGIIALYEKRCVVQSKLLFFFLEAVQARVSREDDKQHEPESNPCSLVWLQVGLVIEVKLWGWNTESWSRTQRPPWPIYRTTDRLSCKSPHQQIFLPPNGRSEWLFSAKPYYYTALLQHCSLMRWMET